MRLCLKCGYISVNTRGNAGATLPLFCPGCGRGSNRRVCGRLHANPPTAKHCGICGGDDLSDSAPYLELGLLPRLLSVLCLVAAWRFVWHNAGPILCLAYRIAMMSLAALFGVPQKAIWMTVANMSSWAMLILIGSLLLPGGKQARQFLGRGLAAAARITWSIVSAAWFSLIVGGRPPKKEKKQ